MARAAPGTVWGSRGPLSRRKGQVARDGAGQRADGGAYGVGAKGKEPARTAGEYRSILPRFLEIEAGTAIRVKRRKFNSTGITF